MCVKKNGLTEVLREQSVSYGQSHWRMVVSEWQQASEMECSGGEEVCDDKQLDDKEMRTRVNGLSSDFSRQLTWIQEASDGKINDVRC